MKRGTFKKRGGYLKRKTKIRVVGVSDTAELKREIQAILREIVIKRDKGCIMRFYPHTGACGAYTKAGNLILQAEHLNTRARMASFADTRLIICLCQRHHIYWKPQHADEYFKIVKEHIGKERAELLEKVQQDYKAHKIDLKLELLGLKKELSNLSLLKE